MAAAAAVATCQPPRGHFCHSVSVFNLCVFPVRNAARPVSPFPLPPLVPLECPAKPLLNVALNRLSVKRENKAEIPNRSTGNEKRLRLALRLGCISLMYCVVYSYLTLYLHCAACSIIRRHCKRARRWRCAAKGLWLWSCNWRRMCPPAWLRSAATAVSAKERKKERERDRELVNWLLAWPLMWQVA